MSRTTKTALGIDIGPTRISMALVRNGRTGPVLAKVARATVPEGMITNGRIADEASFTKLLKGLKTRHGIRAKDIAVSLAPGIILTRLARLGETDPQRIREAIAAEVRQYASLSGRKTASDFRLVTPVQGTTSGRALIAACDHEAIAALVRATDSASVPVCTIEPAVLACLRMCHLRPGTILVGENTAVVLLQGSSVTTCLFHSDRLELIRTKSVDTPAVDPTAVCSQVIEEIRAMLAFGRMDGGRDRRDGRVILVDDGTGFALSQLRDSVAQEIPGVTLDCVTPADSPVPFGSHVSEQETVSLSALGAAMGLLDAKEVVSKVNLLPPEDPAAKRLQTMTRLATAACAVVMVLTLAITHFLDSAVEQAVAEIAVVREGAGGAGFLPLNLATTELRALEDSAGAVAEETEYLRQIDRLGSGTDWAQLLDEIRAAVPGSVCITEMSTHDAGELIVEGLSRSSASVHVLAEALCQSARVQDATVVSTRRPVETPDLVEYTIKCTIGPLEER